MFCPRMLLLTAALLGGTACATVASRTTDGGVTGGLEALGQTGNQDQIAALLTSPQIQAATQDLAKATLAAALASMDSDELQVLIQRRSDAFVHAIGPAIQELAGEEVGPVLRAQLVLAVQDAASALATDPVRADVKSFAVAISQAVVGALAPQVSAEVARSLRDELGPALEQVIVQNLGPALAVTLQRDLGPAIQGMLGPITDEVVHAGTNALMEEATVALRGELGMALRELSNDLTDDVVRESEAASKLLSQVAAAIGAVLAVLAGVLGLLLHRMNGHKNKRQGSLEMVLGVIKAQAEGDPGTMELVRRIRDTGKETESGRFLSDFLDERRHLKVSLSKDESG